MSPHKPGIANRSTRLLPLFHSVEERAGERMENLMQRCGGWPDEGPFPPARHLTPNAMNSESSKSLAAKDPVMGALIDRIGLIALSPRRLPVFQSLAQSIIHQQLSGKAAGTILKRFINLFPSLDFPDPQAVLSSSEETLRSVGLSRPKSRYIRDLAERTSNLSVPTLDECDALSDAELIERYTAIKGVGKWTVEMLLIFNLGRPDVLPIHDLGVQKGFQITYRKRRRPTPEELDRAGRKWKPYRSLAALYLWRAADTPSESGGR